MHEKVDNKVFRLLMPVFLVLLLWGQTGIAAGKELTITLLESKIQDLTAEGLTLSFLVRIENKSETPYLISSYQYRVLVNEKEYFTQLIALENEKLEIKPGEPVLVNFPVRLSYQYLKPFLTENQKQANCQVSGQMYFVGEKKKVEKIPFVWEMSFPIFKLPGLKFWPLQVKALTLGGAEFDFVFSMVNDNAYEVLVQDVNLELILANKTIFNGKIEGDKTLAAGQEKTFKLSLLLDFFEQGRELRDELEKEKPEFKLKALVRADSAWGPFSFMLEKTDRVEKQLNR
ncbi:MAG: hypothetical protein H5U07_04995 [Candidatus Aminicenantes bacterium]|nr:hypothetical protein [Candidatus Aminicenantes bacterium]